MPKFLKVLWGKLFLINDAPQKIAIGLGLGVFCGIFPGVGPLAALFLAFIFRANRASAVLGCLLTNTWLSFLTFILAIKIGSAVYGISWTKLYQSWVVLIKGFYWRELFKSSALEIILPVLSGYLIIAIFSGLLAYLISLIIISNFKKTSR